MNEIRIGTMTVGGMLRRVSGGHDPGVVPANTHTLSPLKQTEFFTSQKVDLDADSGLFVLRLRDSGTGEVAAQVPDEKAVAEYRKTLAAAPKDPGKTSITTNISPKGQKKG